MEAQGVSTTRNCVGVLATLLVSAVAAYLLFLYALSLGFDGPGVLSVRQAFAWTAIAVATAVGGTAGAVSAGWLLTRNWAISLVAAAPGAVASMYLLVIVIGLATDLARR